MRTVWSAKVGASGIALGGIRRRSLALPFVWYGDKGDHWRWLGCMRLPRCSYVRSRPVVADDRPVRWSRLLRYVGLHWRDSGGCSRRSAEHDTWCSVTWTSLLVRLVTWLRSVTTRSPCLGMNGSVTVGRTARSTSVFSTGVLGSISSAFRVRLPGSQLGDRHTSAPWPSRLSPARSPCDSVGAARRKPGGPVVYSEEVGDWARCRLRGSGGVQHARP